MAVTLLISSVANAQTALSQDEAAIRSVVQSYVQARNSKDAEATANLFVPDADQLVSTGEWRKGRDSLLKGAMASSRRETGTSSIEVESVRFADSTVAIADGRYQTSMPGSSARQMWTTLVLKRTDQGWKIFAIRNMLPSQPAPSPAP